jgi:hypothetical protein
MTPAWLRLVEPSKGGASATRTSTRHRQAPREGKGREGKGRQRANG